MLSYGQSLSEAQSLILDQGRFIGDQTRIICSLLDAIAQLGAVSECEAEARDIVRRGQLMQAALESPIPF